VGIKTSREWSKTVGNVIIVIIMIIIIIIIIIEFRCSGYSLPKISGFVKQWGFSDSVSVTCSAHAQYHIVMCSLSGSTIFFPHSPTNGKILGEKFSNTKCVFFISFATFVWNICYCKKKSSTYYQKCTYVSM